MILMHEEREPIDEVSLHNWLQTHDQLDKAGGVKEVIYLSNRVPTAVNAETYARNVGEKAVLRRLIAAGTDMVQKCYAEVGDLDDFLDEIEGKIFQLTEKQRVRQSAWPMREIMRETVQKLETLFEEKKAVTGVPGGFLDLDLLTSGFQPGDLSRNLVSAG